MRFGRIKSVSCTSPVSEVHKGYGGKSTSIPEQKQSYTGNDAYWKEHCGNDWKNAHDEWERKDDEWWKSQRTDDIRATKAYIVTKLESFLRKTQPAKDLKWYQVIAKYDKKQDKQDEDKLKEDIRLLNLLISKYEAGDMPAIYAEGKTLSEKIDDTQHRIRKMSERLHEICEHAPSHPIIEQKAGEMK